MSCAKFLILTGVMGVASFLARDAAAKGDVLYATPTPMPLISSELSGRDMTFFQTANQEIVALKELSGLAATHATTPEVKADAQITAKEQGDLADKLAALATRKGAPVEDATVNIGKLKNLAGLKFDKAYLDAAGDAQDRLQSALDAEANSADADIKAFAQAAGSTLKAEQERMRKLGL